LASFFLCWAETCVTRVCPALDLRCSQAGVGLFPPNHRYKSTHVGNREGKRNTLHLPLTPSPSAQSPAMGKRYLERFQRKRKGRANHKGRAGPYCLFFPRSRKVGMKLGKTKGKKGKTGSGGDLLSFLRLGCTQEAPTKRGPRTNSASLPQFGAGDNLFLHRAERLAIKGGSERHE